MKMFAYTLLIFLSLFSCTEEEVVPHVAQPLSHHIKWEVSIDNAQPTMMAYFELSGSVTHSESKPIVNGVARGETNGASGCKAFIKLDTKGDRHTYYFHLKIWQNNKLIKHAYGKISGGTVSTWLTLK